MRRASASELEGLSDGAEPLSTEDCLFDDESSEHGDPTRRSLDLYAKGESAETSSRVERLLRERVMQRVRSQGNLSDKDESEAGGSEHGSTSVGASSVGGGVGGSSTSLSAALTPALVVRPQRLVVVANRLHLTARLEDGEWKLVSSSGGLVSAMLGIMRTQNLLWIGWPGIYLEPGPVRDKLTAEFARHGCMPVWLDEQTVDDYYNGYCNNVLWPLFHYVPMPMETALADTSNMNRQYAAYRRANVLFSESVLTVYQPEDVVWCHDYHLLLMPGFLKEKVPAMKMGFFLHTPFPSSEIYRALPLREEILNSMLKNDLVGFHTYDYARHFVSACTRILGCEGTPEGVEDKGQMTRVTAFPIGINPDRFTTALQSEVVQKHIEELRARFKGRKVMLGVDRLDMIKGIPQKLLGFEKFLEEHPEWQDRVLLVQIAVPTRQEVLEYKRLAQQVHGIVGRICGRFGTLSTVPIHHLDRSLGFEELCALYAVTDVALITSLRDGMNLVSYEYVACQSDNAGVLVLSEFAGAAQSLGAGAILVNPWNINDISSAIEDALTMAPEERRLRHEQMYRHVSVHTATAWADMFVAELNDTHVEMELRVKKIPPLINPDEILHAFNSSRQRVFILGYNATLTTAVEAPRRLKQQFDQIRALTRLHPKVPDAIRKLAAQPDTHVCIFSGSHRNRLDEQFKDLPVYLAAENGVFIRAPGGEWETTMETSNLGWYENVKLVFDYFTERTPRSFVDSRDTSLVWNYKYSDPEFGRTQANDLLQHMRTGPISNANVDVVQGAKSVEVRPVGVSKGNAVEQILRSMQSRGSISEVDFVFSCGHFLSRDEDLFAYLEGLRERSGTPGQAAAPEFNFGGSPPMHQFHAVGDDADERNLNLFTCTVGRKRSQARYFVSDSDDTAAILQSLAIGRVVHEGSWGTAEHAAAAAARRERASLDLRRTSSYNPFNAADQAAASSPSGDPRKAGPSSASAVSGLEAGSSLSVRRHSDSWARPPQ